MAFLDWEGVIHGHRRAALIEDDALRLLQALPCASVDAVVTDPPWGVGFRYASARESRDADAHWAFLSPFYREWMRVLRPGGLLACWQAKAHMRRFWDWFGDDIHIYAAAHNFSPLRRVPINHGYNPVVMLYKPGAEPLRPAAPRRNVDFFVANVAGLSSRPDRIERGHPCPKPVDLMEAILDNFTAPTAVVLDPFAGSGSTAVAALRTGRRFVGAEIEPSYAEIARRRIADALVETEVA